MGVPCVSPPLRNNNEPAAGHAPSCPGATGTGARGGMVDTPLRNALEEAHSI